MSSVSSSDDQFILVYSGSKSGLVHVPYIIRRYAIVLYDLPGTLIVLIDPPEILRSLALRMELFLKFVEIAVVLQKTRGPLGADYDSGVTGTFTRDVVYCISHEVGAYGKVNMVDVATQCRLFWLRKLQV